MLAVDFVHVGFDDYMGESLYASAAADESDSIDRSSI